MPETSVIIRAYNEEKHLPSLFDSLTAQTYRDFEVVVVDSGSFDSTREIAQQRADRVIRIHQHDFTFGYSLNVGVRHSAGRFVAIVSAHTLPVDADWLGRLVEPLHDEQTAMVYGRQLGAPVSKFSEGQDLRRTFGVQRLVLRPPRFFANNANSAVRRDLWQQHPFDETLPGLEDIEWAKYWMERGYQVVYEPEAALYHIHEESWRQVRRRYYREAVAARWIGIKGRPEVLTDPAKEAGYLFLDFVRALSGSYSGRVGAEKKFLKRGREMVLFRVNKAAGTVRGLLDGTAQRNPVSRKNIYFDRSCRAVVIHAPGKVSLEELRLPEIKPGDVLIRVAYEGVCATDLEMFDGTLNAYKEGTAQYPIVPGHEFSGRAVAIGSNVSHLKEGDPVVVERIQTCGLCLECLRGDYIGCAERVELGVVGRNGGYGEYVVTPGRFVHPLPSNLDLCKACLCEPLAVALKGLKRLSRSWSPASADRRCAVVGAGPLGYLCARVLASQGHRVTVFDRNPLRRSSFADSDVEVSDDLARLNEFEALIEATGDPEALHAMLHESSAGATILLLGLPYAQRAFSFENIVNYDKTVVGSVGSDRETFEEAIRRLPDLDLDVCLQCIMPLDHFREAWEHVRQRRHLKVLLKAGGGSWESSASC